jgi:hypothetical protein
MNDELFEYTMKGTPMRSITPTPMHGRNAFVLWPMIGLVVACASPVPSRASSEVAVAVEQNRSLNLKTAPIGEQLSRVSAMRDVGSAPIQVVDVAATIQALINSNGPVPYTHVVTQTQSERTCRPKVELPLPPPFNVPAQCGGGESEVNVPGVPYTQCCSDHTVTTSTTRTDQVVPVATGIHVAFTSPVQMGPLVTTELPDQLTVDAKELMDCSPISSNQTVSLSVAFQRSYSASLSSTVTNTSSASINISAGPPFLKVGASYTVGSSNATGSVNTNGNATTITRTSSLQVPLQSGQAVVAQLEVWPVTYTQTFTATVVVDADLSSNDRYAHLSDLVTGTALRTFQIAGSVVITDASGGRIEQLADPNNPCAAGRTGALQVPYHPSVGHPLLRNQ